MGLKSLHFYPVTLMILLLDLESKVQTLRNTALFPWDLTHSKCCLGCLFSSNCPRNNIFVPSVSYATQWRFSIEEATHSKQSSVEKRIQVLF